MKFRPEVQLISHCISKGAVTTVIYEVANQCPN